MSWIRIALLSLAVAAVAAIAGAMADPPVKPAPIPAPAAAPPAAAPPAVNAAPADPAATKVLAEAVEALDRKRLAWLDTRLWQQIDVQGLTIESEGTYLSGPDYRLHLDLNVRLDDARGKMEIVCDGTTLWEVMKFGEKEPTVTKVAMKSVLAALDHPEAEAVRDEYMQRWTFTGVAPLLRGLQNHVVFTKKEDVTWKDRKVVKLTGGWSPAVSTQLAPDPKAPWEAFLPRQCCLYLDAETHWPHRLEWWGPSPPATADVMLLQMEFRDPKFTEISAERCAKTFSYATTSSVADKTSNVVEELNMRVRQLRK